MIYIEHHPTFVSETKEKSLTNKKFKTMSQIGKEVVDFKVQAYANEKFETVSKEDTLGKWAIYFFYPADFTFVCPTELEDLANSYDEFKATGTEIYSVSTDSHFVHKAWHDASETIKKINGGQ